MSRRLKTYVHVHLEDAPSVVYGPDDDIPAEHEALITNPKAWEETPEPEVRRTRNTK